MKAAPGAGLCPGPFGFSPRLSGGQFDSLCFLRKTVVGKIVKPCVLHYTLRERKRGTETWEKIRRQSL